MERPLLFVKFCRKFYRQEGFRLVVILAPFPPEEQEPGAYCRALMNLQVDFSPRWPFVEVDCYAPDRTACQ